MRKDMYRVVTERPRRGSGARNRKSRLKIRNYDESMDSNLPKRQPMLMRDRTHQYGEKEFSDVLGPIERWLHSQVGRPWSKVYSEIRKALPATAKEPIRHIWDAHIRSQIQMNCRMGVDGKVYTCRMGSFNTSDLNGWEPVKGTGTFYIHPINNLFLYADRAKVPHQPRPPWGNGLKQLTTNLTTSEGYEVSSSGFRYPKYKHWLHDPETGEKWATDAIVLIVDSNTKAIRRNGIWYLQYYKMHSLQDIAYQKVVIDKHEQSHTIPITYAQDKSHPRKYCYSTKQANRKELKKLGLKNASPADI